MYMREMGTVDLLTREDEISIAKRIEEGIDEVQTSIAAYPEALNGLLKNYDDVEKGNFRLADLITGFVDPNAEIEEHNVIDETFLKTKKNQKVQILKTMKMRTKANQNLHQIQANLIIALIQKSREKNSNS